MRLTEQILDVEVIVASLLREAGHEWMVWHDGRSKRDPYRPTFLALHVPSRRILGVYPRPRRLAPSELPDASWLPASIEAVVWHPAMRPQIRAWLGHATGDAPGKLDRPTTGNGGPR